VTEVLDRLEAKLKESGAGFDTLLKVNVYLTDFDNWDLFNSIYLDRVGQYGTPPRTTVEISRLGFDSLIEIAAIAYVRPSSRNETASLLKGFEDGRTARTAGRLGRAITV
jgi:enamine deaminase RidA (YjgF/YER057c/UK114 family)